MKIKMRLLSDTIFGNGRSLPGEEDISVLSDGNGFPYYKGGTFKGIFREELSQYLALTGGDEQTLVRLLGYPGDDEAEMPDKLVFSDFVISDAVKCAVLSEIGTENPEAVLDAFTSMRAFTKIGADGTAYDGSLRVARCVNKDIVLFSEILCSEEDEELVENVLGLVKSIGSMRNRGFGRVRISRNDERCSGDADKIFKCREGNSSDRTGAVSNSEIPENQNECRNTGTSE